MVEEVDTRECVCKEEVSKKARGKACQDWCASWGGREEEEGEGRATGHKIFGEREAMDWTATAAAPSCNANRLNGVRALQKDTADSTRGGACALLDCLPETPPPTGASGRFRSLKMSEQLRTSLGSSSIIKHKPPGTWATWRFCVCFHPPPTRGRDKHGRTPFPRGQPVVEGAPVAVAVAGESGEVHPPCGPFRGPCAEVSSLEPLHRGAPPLQTTHPSR